MLSLLSTSSLAAAGPPSSSYTNIDIDALLSINDPWQRLQLAADRVKDLEDQLTVMRAVRRDAVGELVHQRRTPLSRVAAFIGLTKTRVGQLAHEAKRAAKGGES